MTNRDDQDLALLLENTAKLLVEDPTNGNPLRNFASQITERQYESLDSFEKFLVYFLIVFIEDVFYNLAGDIPYYQDVTESQHIFFKNIGEKFNRLGVLFRNKDHNGCFKVLEEIVDGYLGIITNLNNATRRSI